MRATPARHFGVCDMKLHTSRFPNLQTSTAANGSRLQVLLCERSNQRGRVGRQRPSDPSEQRNRADRFSWPRPQPTTSRGPLKPCQPLMTDSSWRRVSLAIRESGAQGPPEDNRGPVRSTSYVRVPIQPGEACGMSAVKTHSVDMTEKTTLAGFSPYFYMPESRKRHRLNVQVGQENFK